MVDREGAGNLRYIDAGSGAGDEAGERQAFGVTSPTSFKTMREDHVPVCPANQTGFDDEALRKFQHSVKGDVLIADNWQPALPPRDGEGTRLQHEVEHGEIGQGEISAVGHVAERVLVGDPDRERAPNR